MEWLHWYYLIYWFPGVTAVVMLFGSVLGGSHSGHGHGLSGHVAGHPLHLGHTPGHMLASGAVPRVVVPGDASSVVPTAGHAGEGRMVHSGVSHLVSHRGTVGQFSGSIVRILFGVGEAPLPVTVGSLMLGWGLGGLLATELLEPILRYPAFFVLPSLLCAVVAALLFTRVATFLTGRLMPEDESYVVSRSELVGLEGTVVFPVSATIGRIHIFDAFGTLHAEPARVRPGVPDVPRGQKVTVVAADPGGAFLLVDPLGFEGDQLAQRALDGATAPVAGSASTLDRASARARESAPGLREGGTESVE